MDTSRALEIVRALADGKDPFTSEAFPMDGPYQHPEVVRALFNAVYALQILRQREKRRESVPLNAGRGWSAPEDAALLLAAEAGAPLPSWPRSTSVLRPRSRRDYSSSRGSVLRKRTPRTRPVDSDRNRLITL